MRIPLVLVFAFCATLFSTFQFQQSTLASKPMSNQTTQLDTATFGAGCFWCVEAVFQRVNGVKSVVSGYTGGHTKNPTYNEVTSGKTGHAEVAQIVFDPGVISFSNLLEIFWETHDPTTLNRQGNDVGTQYRSAIFYNSDTQKQEAQRSKAAAEASGSWKNPIVTEITALGDFYEAEDYHQNYYNLNTYQPYCQFVISPKLKKFEKQFEDKLNK